VDILTDKDFVHPADALATALDRVAGLLAILGDFYNPRLTSFSGGNEFVMHALSTASELVVEARGALGDLHQNCNLSLIEEEVVEDSPRAAEDVPSVEVPDAVPMTWSVDRAPIAEQAGAKATEQDIFAQSYLELLKKLTAAEVFAAEQQALAAPGQTPELLPLLRGLREEFQKMHRVA
jgi:hypothetical protein